MGKKLDFETGLNELEEIVARLERGSVSLDESFKDYQKGVELYKALKALLDEGDAKITLLTSNGEQPFIPEDTNENA